MDGACSTHGQNDNSVKEISLKTWRVGAIWETWA